MSRPPESTDERPSQTYRSSDRYRAGARALGARIRQIRHDRGMSLYEAAERMQIELSYLHRLESGKLNVTLATIMRAADGLGVAVGELFVGDAFAVR